MSFITSITDFITLLLLLIVLFVFLSAVIMAVLDRTQTAHSVLRNFPFVGRFRYWFEKLGEFLRQYFFALDQEELPFNRSQRSWAYRAAKDENNTVSFGSKKDLNQPGTYLFLNSGFPKLDQETLPTQTLTLGPNCRVPYTPASFFNISAMSYGALSKNAVLALSKGAKKAGCWLNTGEGGLSTFHLQGGADIVFQIGTAKYGVRDEHGIFSATKLEEIAAHPQVKMFEIKLSQGAKPGKGGILPAEKVTAEIAKIRGIEPGKASISPNRHPDIGNVDELIAFINTVREVTGKPTGIKFVLGSPDWLIEFLDSISKRGAEFAPDFITLDSGDGGTGAAPMPLMDSVGLPLRDSLPKVDDLLRTYGLRKRIRLIATGKLIIPTNVAAALAMGADFCSSARGFMFSLGCIQAFQCNKNTCPTGITTHDIGLQRGLVPDNKAERVYHYHKNMEKEVGLIAHSCGVEEPRKLRRHHARIVIEGGKSVLLDVLYPYADAN